MFYGIELRSRLLLGTARYPSPAVLERAIKASGAEVVTVSLRREGGSGRSGQSFWSFIQSLGLRGLPNTAGCHSVKEAVTTAHMARELFDTKWIKLEVIGDDDTLQPDVFGLVEAARILSEDGFEVFPYTTEDLVVAERLVEAGCKVLMPWGAPIGSARGLNNVYGLRTLRAHFPDIPLVVDAGLGVPSHAAAAMELGYDAVLLNTAVAEAGDPVEMARAFALAVEADRQGCAGRMSMLDPFYPIVPDSGWVARLVPAGARLIQLRIKEQPAAEVRRQVKEAKAACAAGGAQLIVNDYWQAAIDEGCDFVHLGQEDLLDADVKALRRAGIRIGVSTHDHAELDKGLAVDPDYVALGPIYPTLLKQMPFAPQGTARLAEWKRLIGDRPLVAIGGLTLERALLCLASGADIASVVGDIVNNADPIAQTKAWVAATRGKP
jgi:thiazole synthase